MELVVWVVLTVGLLLLGWLAGSATERRHLKSLTEREALRHGVLVTDLRALPGAKPGVPPAKLFVAEVVIGADFLKSFLASLRFLFGGEVRSFQTLVDRARREAILRVVEQAAGEGFDAVGNVRIEMADLAGAATRSGGIVAVGVVASGTGYRRQLLP